MIYFLLYCLFEEYGTSLSMTRKTSGNIITAAGFNTNYDEVEAVVNGNIDSDSNIVADGVKAVALNSDVVRSGFGLIQHTDGSLYVDVSDTNPSLEITDGGIRAIVAELINRTSSGLTWGRSGDVLFSSSSTTPTNFTDNSTTYSNKFIRINATALSAAAPDATTDSHVLTVAEMPAHTHTIGGNDEAASGSAKPVPATGTNVVSSSTGGGGGHTHTMANAQIVPSYVTLRMYSKD